MDLTGSVDNKTETNAESIRYKLDQYVLDPTAMRLIDATNNQLISEDEKLIAAMTLLASRYPEIVTKNELMETIWPGLVVTDWSITRFIADTRKILGENHHIKTVHGRGYRYNHPVIRLGINDDALSPAKNSLTSKKAGYVPYPYLVMLLIVIFLLLLIHNQNVSSMQKKAPSIALVPVDIKNENPAWQWGIAAFLSEKITDHSLQTVNLNQLQYELDAWQQANPDKKLDQLDITKFCQVLGCSKILFIYQNEHRNEVSLRYEILSDDGKLASKEFSGSDLYQSMKIFWPDLHNNLHLSATISTNDAPPYNAYIMETYIEALGNLVEKDWTAATSLLKLLIEKYPNFINAKILLANIMSYRNEVNAAQDIIDTLALNTLNKTDLCKINIIKTQIFLQKNKTDAAMQTATMAEKIAIESESSNLQAISLLNSGQLKLTIKQSSIEYFQKAEVIFDKNNNQYAVAKTQLCMAESYEFAQNQSLANESRQKANKMLNQLNDDGDRLCNPNGVMMAY